MSNWQRHERATIDKMDPRELAQYAHELCEQALNERVTGWSRSDSPGLYEDLLYVQKKLRSYRIRMAKVRGIRVVQTGDSLQ